MTARKALPGVPVKLPMKGYEEAKRLLAHVSRHGWASVGVDRDDPPSLATVLEESVLLLGRQRKAQP